MATNPAPLPAVPDDLAGCRRELVEGIRRSIELWVQTQQLMNPAQADAVTEAAEKAQAPLHDRYRQMVWDDPDQMSWSDLSRLMNHDPEQGQAAWQKVKQQARVDLATGSTTARSLEPWRNAKPQDRAAYLVTLEAFRADLQPRGAVEDLLCQQLAAAFLEWTRWQALATYRSTAEEWHGERDRRRARENMTPARRERDDQDYGWVPPRLSDADAVEQAVMIADRYQRAYLRLLKTFRDMRRVLGNVTITGGQLNVADQQTVLQGPQQAPESPLHDDDPMED